MVTDMVLTSWHGVENAKILVGESVAVFGIGSIGLCAIAAARMKGVGRIFAQTIVLTRGDGEICGSNAYHSDVVIDPAAWSSGVKTQTIGEWQCAGGRVLLGCYLKMISLGLFDPSPLAAHVFHGLDQMRDSLWAKKKKECLKPVCIIE